MSLIFAMVGTDHHPFHRLVDWMDEAARRHPETRFVVQHGESKAPILAEGHAYLPHAQISELLAEADGAVVRGGPGTIMDARAAGHVPICVPRDPALGEHIDGHQQRFAALVGPAGVVHAVATIEEFHDRLDRALTHSPSQGAAIMATRVRDTARARLAAELDELITVRPHRLARRYRATP